MMKKRETPIEDLTNIGETVARRLKEIDIHTYADLERVGAINAYMQMCANYPDKTMPVCYYLYSLEGALKDQHWNSLPKTLKQELLSAVRK
jgi:DNA transformation protein